MKYFIFYISEKYINFKLSYFLSHVRNPFKEKKDREREKIIIKSALEFSFRLSYITKLLSILPFEILPLEILKPCSFNYSLLLYIIIFYYYILLYIIFYYSNSKDIF